MIERIGAEPKPYPRVHCCPEALIGSGTLARSGVVTFSGGESVTLVWSQSEEAFVVHHPHKDAVAKLRRDLLKRPVARGKAS